MRSRVQELACAREARDGPTARKERTCPCAASNIDLINIAQEPCECVDVAGSAGGLFGATAMPEVSVPFPLRCTTAGAVHPANAIAFHRGRSAWKAGAL
jgi:hypothetical protein